MACPSDDILLSWRSGKLSGDAVRVVEQHVDQCADCQAVLHAAAASFEASRTEVGATHLPAPLAPGEIVAGRYRIVHFVGSGGMGTVYAALDEELGQSVALKTLHERFANDPHAIMRLKREALLARRITHANVCRIFDVGYDRREGHGSAHPPHIFLTMELLRGETLRQRLRRGCLTMSEARPLVDQLAAALGAAHAGGVIHRDLKSDNVILIATETGTRVVVTDFGLARAILGDDTRLSRSGALIGTPAYMAPEQILAGPVDTTVDIYALGVVMFEMLTGELPFGASPSPSPIKERLMGRPRSPRALVPELSASWERVVMRCLEPEPGDRFARVDEIVAALDAVAPRRRSRVGKLATTTGALVVLGLITLVGLTGAHVRERAAHPVRPAVPRDTAHRLQRRHDHARRVLWPRCRGPLRRRGAAPRDGDRAPSRDRAGPGERPERRARHRARDQRHRRGPVPPDLLPARHRRVRAQLRAGRGRPLDAGLDRAPRVPVQRRHRRLPVCRRRIS